jgi:hypothetical protein
MGGWNVLVQGARLGLVIFLFCLSIPRILVAAINEAEATRTKSVA